MTFIKRILASLFGQVQWQAPSWLSTINNSRKQNAEKFWVKFIALIVFVIIIITGIKWYLNLPQPEYIQAKIIPPTTELIAKGQKQPALTINFYENNASGGQSIMMIAPLELVNKTVSTGITITPELKGTWRWQGQSQLTFTPDSPWPAGKMYHIHFAKTVFTKNTTLATYDHEFTTVPFTASISQFFYYQSPKDPSVHQTVATVNFNYPVNQDSFKEHVSLALQADKKHNLMPQSYEFKIKFDKFSRIAYITSATIQLPDVERFMILTLHKGIKPEHGPSITKDDLTDTTKIPTISSFVKINSINAHIVRDKNNKPEQILSINISPGVTLNTLEKYLSVYLLPQNVINIDTGKLMKNYTWYSPSQVNEDILQHSEKLDLLALPTMEKFNQQYNFLLNANSNRYLYIKINKGMPVFGTYHLANLFHQVIKVPSYPRELNFVHQGALLALNGPRQIEMATRNVPAIKYEIARVLPNEINHFVTQTQGNFSHPQFVSYHFDEKDLSAEVSTIKYINNATPALQQFSYLDVGQYLKQDNPVGEKLGLFFIKATAWDPKNKYSLGVDTSRVILITDMGLIVKNNENNTHDLFVQSIVTGLPLGDCAVSVLGRNGLAIFTGTTDEQGHLNIPSLKNFTGSQQPVAYVVTKGDDVSFMPYDRSDRTLQTSRFDTGGITEPDNHQDLRAYLFSDRGLYRPSEKVHLAMIVKPHDLTQNIQGIPVELEITNPRGNTLVKEKVNLTNFGYLTYDFQTQRDSFAGMYQARLYLMKKQHRSFLLGSTTFRVEDFMPDTMKIKMSFNTKNDIGWVNPTNIEAKVTLTNLYGTPASQRRIEAKMTLSPSSFYFSRYNNYHFLDPLINKDKKVKYVNQTLPAQSTNQQGDTVFKLPLSQYTNSSYRLNVFATGFSASGGRGVSTDKSLMISPLSYIVGYYSKNDLDTLKLKEHYHVDILALNPKIDPIKVSHLELKRIALNNVSVLVQQANGTFQYQTKVKQKIMSTTSFPLDDKPTPLNLNTEKTGQYQIQLIDTQMNKIVTKFDYTVIGGENQPLQNSVLKVHLDKKSYSPGENIVAQISAPYTGSGLITIEKDKVYSYRWFTMTSHSTEVTIPTPKALEGNGYVNVTLTRAYDSSKKTMNPLSYTIVPFTLSKKEHQIKITLDTLLQTEPGKDFHISYHTDKPSQIIVYAVNEGILQTANYSLPNPLSYFFQKQALQVATMQTIDLILPRFLAPNLSAPGGGEEDEGIGSARSANAMAFDGLGGSGLNPFTRKLKKPVAYWSGLLNADSSSQTLSFPIRSDFNGTLRVMAIAVNQQAFGRADKLSIIKGPYIIVPNTPTFAAPGDQFKFSVTVANNIKDNDKPTTVSIKTSAALSIEGENSKTLTIPSGEEKTILFVIKVSKPLGNANIDITASNGTKESHTNATLSVRPAVAFSTDIINGTSLKEEETKSVNTDFYPQYRHLSTIANYSPLILANGLDYYLTQFPFGCTEQSVSKVFPLLALSKVDGYPIKRDDVTKKYQHLLQQLRSRQAYNGSFYYWPGSTNNPSNQFVSIYTVDFLTEAKAQGFNVPPTMLTSGLNYLKTIASANTTDISIARKQAYAIYVLTKNGIVTTNYLTKLRDTLNKNFTKTWQQDITGAYIAACYKLLQFNDSANQLIKKYQFTKPNPNEFEDFYDSLSSNSQYIILLSQHFPEMLNTLTDEQIQQLLNPITNMSYNSYSAALAIRALASIAKATEGNNQTISITARNNQNNIIPLPLAPSKYQATHFPAETKHLTFQNNSGNKFYFQITQAGFSQMVPNAKVANDIEIYREYDNDKGQPIHNVKIGENVTVKIRLRSTNDKIIPHIAIVDLLPGGFDVVNNSINRQLFDYVNPREDRVLFFTAASPNIKTFTYKIKAVNQGQFTIPPIYATSMYVPTVKARGLSGEITITKATTDDNKTSTQK